MNPNPGKFPAYFPTRIQSASSMRLAAMAMLSLAASALWAAPPADSPYGASPSHRFGQVRTRTEYVSKNMTDTASNKAALSTNLRTRLGFTTNPSEKVELKVEMQDTRNFGSEPMTGTNAASTTVSNAKGLDLLQGYFAITEGTVKAVLGRQKMSLGSGRYLSTLEWHPYSRAFDGVSFNWGFEPGNLTGFLYTVADQSAATIDDAAALSGLYYSHSIKPGWTVDAYGFYDMSRIPGAISDLVYLGERFSGTAGLFTFEEEFIWQMGDQNVAGADVDNAAFQLGLRVGAALPTGKINIGLDAMSGDDGTDKTNNTYKASYYFGHAFFGWMDYFLANPKYGVMDYRIDASFNMLAGGGKPKLTLMPAYHFFTPQSAPSGMDDPYGQEIDLELHAMLYPQSKIIFGAAMFLPGDGAINMGTSGLPNKTASTKPGMYFYFMPIFNF